jgi:hypothetical protein
MSRSAGCSPLLRISPRAKINQRSQLRDAANYVATPAMPSFYLFTVLLNLVVWGITWLKKL